MANAPLLPSQKVIPEFMTARDQWLVWEHTYPGTEEERKHPLRLASIRRFVDAYETGAKDPGVYTGSANDLENVTHYKDAYGLASYLHDTRNMASGIGYALIGDDRMIVFDFDDVLDEHGKFTDAKVEAVVKDLATYTEVSPGGLGVHAYVAVSIALKQRIKETVKSWCSFQTKQEDGGRHSVYIGAGYTTITGRKLSGYSKPFNEAADTFVDQWFKLRFPGHSKRANDRDDTALDLDEGGVSAQVADALSHLDADCDRDTWVRVGMILHKITQGDERGQRLWDTWSQKAPHRYPKRNQQSTRAIYRSFTSAGNQGVSLGTLLHMAKEAQGGDSREEVKQARERLQRTITVAQSTLSALAAARGVTTLPTSHSAEGLDIVPMSKLPNEATRWLWTYMVPFGHLVLVSGGVSSGKSTSLLKLTADVSKAKPLPYDNERKRYQARLDKEFGEDNPLSKPYKLSGVVYYLTSEMHWTQTAAPTLRRCGANENRVFFMRKTVIKDKAGKEKSRPFDLVTDLDRLIRHIIATKIIPDMIILDPITSFMGTQVDRNAESDVRGILELMADFCASIGIAFIGVLHQNKSLDHSGVGKLLGSIAFGAVARVVLFVWPCEAPQGGESEKAEWEVGSKYFGVTVEKSNIGPTDTAHIFRASSADKIGMDVVYVEDKPVRDFLREMHKTKDDKAAPKREHVLTFITEECLTKAKVFGTKLEAQTFIAQNVNCSVSYAQQIINESFAWACKEDGSWTLKARQLN